MGVQQKTIWISDNYLPIEKGDLTLRYNKGLGKYDSKLVPSGKEMIGKWKVIISYVSYDHAGQPDKDGKRKVMSVIEILPPKTICTETYLVAGVFDNEAQAKNLKLYLETKFVRFLVSQIAVSQHITKNCFTFVPVQDFSKPWTDKELYKKYKLTKEEIAFIESMIRPMDGGESDE
jgi:site-specific DNA-methyltransferase (adenine-specific)